MSSPVRAGGLRLRLRVSAPDRIMDLELTAPAGAPVAVVGPNGAGKTTLLRALLGARASRGVVTLDGEILFDSERGIDVPLERRHFGYVPQRAGLLPHLTAVGQVQLALSCRGVGTRRNRRRIAEELLEGLGLSTVFDHRPDALSGGQRQLVALARALASAPRVLLLDEPTDSLDTRTRHRVHALLAERIEALALPTIVVTHSIEEVRRLARAVAVLEDGRILACAPLNVIQRHPPSLFAASLLAATPDVAAGSWQRP